MAPCPDAEVIALAPSNFLPYTRSVGSSVTEIIRKEKFVLFQTTNHLLPLHITIEQLVFFPSIFLEGRIIVFASAKVVGQPI